MKRFAFVSDFDNTISKRDFYRMMMDKYLGEKGEEFYTEWKKTKKINVEFLNEVFSYLDLSEEELKEEIMQIPIDETAFELMRKIRNSENGFYIVSAGTSYYIDILFEERGIIDIDIISMKGVYEDDTINIKVDEDSPYYSDVFGIDKKKVVEHIRAEYDLICYAGDSEPDMEAAKSADLIFAKGELAEMLTRDGIKFVEFENFDEIEKYLIEEEWLDESASA